MTDGVERSFSTDGPKCPKCGFTFTPDESHYYDEHRYTEDECQECGCKFSVRVNLSASWTCQAVARDHGEGSRDKEG